MLKKKSQLPVNPTQKDQLHYNAVLLEEIRSQMNVVIETTEVTRETLEAKIEEVRTELKQEIQITQMAVKANSVKLQEHDQRFDNLEKDVKEIKQKLEGVVEKIERHDEEITFLKSAVPQT